MVVTKYCFIFVMNIKTYNIMSKTIFINSLDSVLEREIDPRETLSQVSHNSRLYWCWGVSRVVNLHNKGLLLSVSGRKHNGFVLITLSWDDTYKVRFYNTKYNETKPMLTNVYCDELTTRIDEVIEKVDGYAY